MGRGNGKKGGGKEGEEMSKARFKEGDTVMMTADALANYGHIYEGVSFLVTHKATSVKEHPGYDSGCGGGLYDLERIDNQDALNFSLYDWELYKA